MNRTPPPFEVFDTVWALPPDGALGNCVVADALVSAGTVVTLAPFVVSVVAVGDVPAVALAVRGVPPPGVLASNVGGLV